MGRKLFSAQSNERTNEIRNIVLDWYENNCNKTKNYSHIPKIVIIPNIGLRNHFY